jgi:Protein of unknown function (DUF2855)
MESMLVDRHRLSKTTILGIDDMPPLANGAVRLNVESFSLTANNISYAALGDRFGYWNFFPASDGMGIVPAWGHAMVAASNHDEIAVGEHVYGFLPMGTHLDVVPGKLTAAGFADLSPHRQAMSPIYNQYSRLAHDPEHDPAREAQRMIFGPLFKTGFLIEAMLRRENWFGAHTLLMTSASSKTAMSLASVAKDLSPAIVRIGLTSERHVAFVESTGLYDRVVAYDDVASLPKTMSVCVDFAGNAALLHAIHERLGDALAYSCLVGVTHVDAPAGEKAGPMPGPAPIVFFAPDHAVATIKELGPKGFSEAVAARWHRFLDIVDGTVAIEERAGLAAAADTYLAILQGVADPGIATVIRP